MRVTGEVGKERTKELKRERERASEKPLQPLYYLIELTNSIRCLDGATGRMRIQPRARLGPGDVEGERKTVKEVRPRVAELKI